MSLMRRMWPRGVHTARDRGVEYVQIYASPLTNASRMFKIARSVHQAGLFSESHMVGVLTPGTSPRDEVSPGLFVVRIPASRRRGNLGRVLRVLLWQPRVYLRYRREPLSVVAAHNVWVLPVCRMLSRKTGASLVYNAHELETETLRMTGLKQRMAKAIESRLIGSCAVTSVVNSWIADWYEDAYPIRRPLVVGNLPVVRDVQVHMRERLGIREDEMVYIHTGNLHEGRNIPLILTAFSSSPHHVVFLGDGYLRDDILARSETHPNIHWLAPVDPELIVAHVREADVGLCLIEHVDLSDQLSSPNKLFEALAGDTPPLCSDLVEARRMLGPLSTDWILDDPERDLPRALVTINKDDVRTFREQWQGSPSWDDEVRPLVEAYRRLTTDHPRHVAPASGRRDDQPDRAT